jgi:hypothetical protein
MAEEKPRYWFNRYSPTTKKLTVKVQPETNRQGHTVVTFFILTLKEKIPFAYTIISAPKKCPLIGRRRTGPYCVEMTIEFSISVEDAVAQLIAKGFMEGSRLIVKEDQRGV